MFRVAPQFGQAFTTDHETDGRHRVALLSDRIWRSRYGADPRVVGRTLEFPAGQWTVIGVMPAGVEWPVSATRPVDLWVPLVFSAAERERGDSHNSNLQVVARLAPGVGVSQADERVRALTAALAGDFPDWFGDNAGAVRLLHEATVGRMRGWMLLLLGAVGLVMLIACVNVASLVLARTAGRRDEIRVRAALGASRWRVARGLMVESLVLSSAGALLALPLAYAGIAVLRASLPQTVPRLAAVSMDGRVFATAAGLALVAGLIAGGLPAIRYSRSHLTASGGRGAVGTSLRVHAALVVGEVALATVLLVAAGLFTMSFLRLANVELGIEPNHALVVGVYPRVDSSQEGWVETARARAAVVVPEILERIRGLPGVEAAGFISGGVPLSADWDRVNVRVPGRDEPFVDDDAVDVRRVTPGYASAIGSRVLLGRHVSPDDTTGSAPVIVLNEEAARRYLGNRDPIGATIMFQSRVIPPVERTVVGIVHDTRLQGPESAVRPEAYVPTTQVPFINGDVVIRTTGDPEALAEAAREAVWASLPEVPPPATVALSSLLQRLMAQRRFNMALIGIFGIVALVIAAAGVHGLLGQLVALRTKEIGVRMALGARPARVVRMVLVRAAAMTAAGLVAGLTAAWVSSASLAAFLFDVTPRDLGVFWTAAALLGGVSLLAALAPALRAARVDPLVALKGD